MIHLVLTVLWLTNLSGTDSYFSIYCLTAAASLFCLSENRDRPFPRGKKALGGGLFFVMMLSLAVLLANYKLFYMAREITNLSNRMNHILGMLEGVVTFLAGIPIFYQILKYFVIRTGQGGYEKTYEAKHPGRFFLLTALMILLIDLTYLFLVVYPGNLSHDTMSQLWQIETGTYNNFTPFWHTQLIRIFMGLGYSLFGTANAAAATFCVVQILVMAFAFAYAMMTLYEIRVPKFFLGISLFMYALLPYNIAFSASIWKDVLYGGAVLLTLAAMYRSMKNVGSHPILDRVVMIFGGVLTCMARTNGVYVMMLTFVILVLTLRKRIRKVLIPWMIVGILGCVMNGPILSAMNIDHIKKVETLSVPLQQVARVVAEEGDISEGDRVLLEKVVDLDSIPEIFWDITVDPVKDALSDGDPDYFFSHKMDYLKLWLRVGTQNPGIYLKAWIDLTRGYWNGGYDYYTYAEYIADNPYGLETKAAQGMIWRLCKSYFAFTRETILFEPMLSIGLMVWLTFLSFYLCVINRKGEAVLYVPLLIIVVCLWVGAPVYSEFRYLYPLFTLFPLLFPIMLYGEK